MTRVWTLALVAALMLAGCAQPAPTPSVTSTPSPTFLCTPEAGGAESACTEQQHREMQQRDALYAEAEQVYREYQAEFWKSLRSGGAHTLPGDLRVLIGNEDTAAAVLRELKNFKVRKLTIEGPDARIKRLDRVPGVSRNGSVVTMKYCLDSVATTFYERGKAIAKGFIGTDTVFFSKATGNGLQMVYVEAKKVKSCDA